MLVRLEQGPHPGGEIRFPTLELAPRSHQPGWSGRDEDAEGVAGRVGEHVERLVGIGRPVEQHRGAERERPVALHGQLVDVRHGQVEVQLLRHRRVRPRRGRQLGDLLDGEARLAGADPSTSQSSPCGSGCPGGGASSPGRYA